MIYKAIIVDDEPHARRYLSDLLATDQDINELGQFGNGKEALAFLEKHQVDIVFLDIEMPNVNGLQVAKKLAHFDHTEIVFTTAYNQYAITAFETHALDYLLKPFDEKRLVKTLQRAKKQIDLKGREALHEKIALLYEDFRNARSPQITEFILKEKGLEFKLRVRKIVAIEADGVYAVLHTNQKSHLHRVTLNDLETGLPASFLRIHRSCIINLDHLDKWQYQNNSTFEFRMDNGGKYTSGRSYLEKVKTALNSERP